jgi:hypothetical protein
MSHYGRYAIIEDLDTVRHIPVGRLWRVPVSITPIIWLGPVVYCVLHVAVSLLGGWPGWVELINSAIAFVIAVEVGTLVHAVGHIAGGTLVGSPMDELLFTSTRGVNIYHGDQSRLPGRVHLGRALGGPVLNLLFAGAVALALRLLAPAGVPGLLGETLSSIYSTSFFIGLGGLLLPLPSVDGQVIWREVLRSKWVVDSGQWVVGALRVFKVH